jgi:Putative transposase
MSGHCERYHKLWKSQAFTRLLTIVRSLSETGFSVDQSVRLEAGDAQGIQRLIQYFLRCPFSQARMIEVTEAGKVIYKTEHNAVGRFPEPGGTRNCWRRNRA